jgi:hypothetical protein
MDGNQELVKLYKFPKTPHLFGSCDSDREDKVLSRDETQYVLSKGLIVQEKVDGDNIGISFDDKQMYLQSRGRFLEGKDRVQFDYLKRWANNHFIELYSAIENRYVLYGELLFARHTIAYDNLFSYVVFFDAFDKSKEEFLKYDNFVNLLKRGFGLSAEVRLVPKLFTKSLTIKVDELSKIEDILEIDKNKLEGLYFREETDRLAGRYKYVFEHFLDKVNSSTHWMNKPLEENILRAKNENSNA